MMDIVELANELVYRVYVMDRVHLHTYFGSVPKVV